MRNVARRKHRLAGTDFDRAPGDVHRHPPLQHVEDLVLAAMDVERPAARLAVDRHAREVVDEPDRFGKVAVVTSSSSVETPIQSLVKRTPHPVLVRRPRSDRRGGAGPHDLASMMRRGSIYRAAAESQWYGEPKRLERLGYLRSEKRPGKTTA
jgi:hypothetical protein